MINKSFFLILRGFSISANGKWRRLKLERENELTRLNFPLFTNVRKRDRGILYSLETSRLDKKL